MLVAVVAVSAAVLVGAVLLALARRRLVVVTVDGLSMSPTLRSGDRVLVLRRHGTRVARGQVVVIEQPEHGHGWSRLPRPDGRLAGRRWYIKRVAAVPGEPVPAPARAAVDADSSGVVPEGKLVVLGDNDRSDDSKQWGYFPADRVLGVVVRRLRRPAR